MSEQGTPGHSGARCERAEWLECHDAPYLRNGKWFVGTGETLRCNACGVCLVPDLEPLPVPEGTFRVKSYSRLTANAQSSYVEIVAYLESDETKPAVWTMRGKTREITEAAWRRAFGRRE